MQIETEYKKALETAQANYDKLGSDYTELLPLLKTHQEKIEEELNALSERSAKDTITGNVPIILAIIATACLGSFFGLRLFGAELQMEWVASGQIIQFMTVMILLSVIMALGLATILHETTLGTLLGGVAGYVLAQGGGPSSCSRCKPKGFAPSAPTASSSGAAARSPPDVDCLPANWQADCSLCGKLPRSLSTRRVIHENERSVARVSTSPGDAVSMRSRAQTPSTASAWRQGATFQSVEPNYR